MKNDEYFLKALNAGCYKKQEWIIDVFTVSEHTVLDNTDDLSKYYHCQVVVDKNGQLGFVDSDNNRFETLDEYKHGEPLFRYADVISLQPNDIPNVLEPVTECYGNVLVNMTILCYPFGSKIPFITGEVDGGKIVKQIIPRITGELSKGDEAITIDELLKHMDAVSALEGWVMLCAPSITVETLTPTPGVVELRDKLLEQHKHELDNPAVIADISIKLANYEREQLKDTEASYFYMSGKSYDVVRMRRFIMYGLEGGFGGTKPHLVTKSLTEGWQMDAFTSMVDGLRSGSYARGKETALGGELYELFQRAFQNVKISDDDCGSKSGIRMRITDQISSRMVGINMIKDGKSIPITESMSKQLVGTVVEVRTPMLCKTTPPNFCKACCGSVLASNPNSVNAIVGDIGSVFMYARMKKMHGKANKTVRLNIENEFS